MLDKLKHINRKWAIIIALAVVAIITALVVMMCTSGDKWKVEGNIRGLANGNLRLVWVDENGTVSEAWVSAVSDRFKAQGHCKGPTLLAIYYGQTRLFTTLLIDVGDNLKLRGDILKPYELECRGNDVCQQWLEWRAKHTVQYQLADRKQLNSEIESYVKTHPKEMLSTLLTLADYTPEHHTQVASLLKLISKDAKPSTLTAWHNSWEQLGPEATVAHISGITLMNQENEKQSVSTHQSSYTLFLMWNTSWLTNREQAIKEINAFQQRHPKSQIVAIYMEADTQAWRPSTRNEAMNGWIHLWAPGGATTASLMPMNIKELPTVIVADSTGRILPEGIKK